MESEQKNHPHASLIE